MVAAAWLSSNRAPECLLLLIDALAYCGLAVLVVTMSGVNYVGATITYLAICVFVNCSRHIMALRAVCNQSPTSEGQLTRLPASITAEDTTVEPSLWPWVPVWMLLFAAGLAQANLQMASLAPLLALIGAEAHFIVCRVHGDCRGGKPAPMLFVLVLHTAAALSGTPSLVTLSLHRLLIVWTYFLTGLRKMYCVGPIWCDGKNLQLMLGIQGLYHEVDTRRGLNFVLSRSRRLCCVASVAVVALQLALPLCLAIPHPAARTFGFACAMSFHASNHILWRINFFVAWCPALLALISPGEQLAMTDILRDAGASIHSYMPRPHRHV